MGKGKDFPRYFHGKEVFQRMNYLYQASHLLLASGKGLHDVSAYYGMLMTASSKRAVLRMEPSVKRGICKGCKVMLIPGVSARVRIKTGKVIWTCLRCGTLKRFPTKRGYKIWVESPEASVDVMTDDNREEHAPVILGKNFQTVNECIDVKNPDDSGQREQVNKCDENSLTKNVRAHQ